MLSSWTSTAADGERDTRRFGPLTTIKNKFPPPATPPCGRRPLFGTMGTGTCPPKFHSLVCLTVLGLSRRRLHYWPTYKRHSIELFSFYPSLSAPASPFPARTLPSLLMALSGRSIMVLMESWAQVDPKKHLEGQLRHLKDNFIFPQFKVSWENITILWNLFS